MEADGTCTEIVHFFVISVNAHKRQTWQYRNPIAIGVPGSFVSHDETVAPYSLVLGRKSGHFGLQDGTVAYFAM